MSHSDLIIDSGDNLKGRLYLGDWEASTDQELIEWQRINSVVTVMSKSMIQLTKPSLKQVNQHGVPAEDSPNFDIYSYFPTATQFIHESLMNGNVLVHCAAGISRSATIVIAYLIKYNKMTLEEALKYVQKRRPIVSPNVGFKEQLKRWEKANE